MDICQESPGKLIYSCHIQHETDVVEAPGREKRLHWSDEPVGGMEEIQRFLWDAVRNITNDEGTSKVESLRS